jgi:DNA repair exonuclease SbcCD ATPase subunit
MPRTDSDKRRSGGLQVADPPASAPAAAAEPQPESLDKVRDILFGSQMRAVDTRLQGLEERLREEHETIRTDFAKQVESLDGFIRSEVQALTERLAAERARRGEELKALSAEIKEALRSLEKRHVRLEESANMADAALRDQLLMQSTTAAAELGKMGERLTAELKRSHAELASAKTDRTALASLLTDMAGRLTAAPSAAPANSGKNGPRS